MDARAKTVREILHSGDQYLVPFFQRSYSWEKRHWERLRDDLESLIEDGLNRQHFMGPLVCTPHNPVPAEVTPYQLIDGQQRLATLIVLLAAVRDVCRESEASDLADEIMEDYIVHRRREGPQRLKIVPRLGDREVFVRMIEGNPAPNDQQTGMGKAYRYYRAWLRSRDPQGSVQSLKDVFTACTARLSLVVITIVGENPYEIFESLNSTGLPLEESDLIRNFIFMQVPLAEQDAFNREHWQPFEGTFEVNGAVPPSSTTAFYRSYLMRKGDYSKAKATFIDFKAESGARGLAPRQLIAEMKRFAGYDQIIHQPDRCASPLLRSALGRVAMLDVATATPLLMHLMDRHVAGPLAEQELLGCIHDFESFIIRRSVCGESTRGYGRWFPSAIREIGDHPRADLQRVWFAHGWPDDSAFIPLLVPFPLYRREQRKCRLIMETLEQSFGHREAVDLRPLTIEHVMPQTIGVDANGRAWRETLGEGWLAHHQKWADTLGNLTLTGYNRELSNRPYPQKRQALSESHLELNRYFDSVPAWTAEAIAERGRQLGQAVAGLWQRPPGAFYQPPAPILTDGEPITDPTQDSPVFVIRQVGVYARMVQIEGVFVVLAGSTARRHGAPTWTGRERRQHLLDEGKLTDDGTGDTYRFAVDVHFDRISGASSQVLARQSNGNIDWRVEGTNMTYDEWKHGPKNE